MPQTPLDPDWKTRPGRISDLTWITELCTRTSFANGFTPRSAIEDHIGRDNYTVLELRGQRAAFMFTSGGRRVPFRIVQSAVSLELWRQGYGQALFQAVTLRALHRPITSATCSVRSGLESNAFWKALGAIHVDTTPGGKVRRKPLLHYAWSIDSLHMHAGQAARDARHAIPERTGIARFIDTHGFLPFQPATPRTTTSAARHRAGIAVPSLDHIPRNIIAPTPDANQAAWELHIGAHGPSTWRDRGAIGTHTRAIPMPQGALIEQAHAPKIDTERPTMRGRHHTRARLESPRLRNVH